MIIDRWTSYVESLVACDRFLLLCVSVTRRKKEKEKHIQDHKTSKEKKLHPPIRQSFNRCNHDDNHIAECYG